MRESSHGLHERGRRGRGDASVSDARRDQTRHAPLRDGGDRGARRGEGDLHDVDEPVYRPVHGLRSLYARFWLGWFAGLVETGVEVEVGREGCGVGAREERDFCRDSIGRDQSNSMYTLDIAAHTRFLLISDSF